MYSLVREIEIPLSHKENYENYFQNFKPMEQI